MRLRERLERLEKHRAQQDRLPYAVFQAATESADESIKRVLAGRQAPKDWKFILAPEPLPLADWVRHHSPVDEMLAVSNPGTSRC